MDLYTHSPIRLHGVVLNSLRTGTTLPLPQHNILSLYVQTGFGLIGLHFTGSLSHTVLTVTSSLPLLGSGFQKRTIPFLWVPELSWAPASSSSQQLSPSGYLTNTSTNSQNESPLTCPAYNIWARTAQKHRSCVALYGTLSSNGTTCHSMYS
jgi:hypothetical protein